MNQINLVEMSDAELATLSRLIEDEINCREEEQFQSLVNNFLQAYSALMSAFPDAACNTYLQCGDCYSSFPLNILELFNNRESGDFSR